jgi:hypothetical protein
VDGLAATVDANNLWDHAAQLIERLGSPDWDCARGALDALDEHLLQHKRSFYCLANRIRGRPEWEPITESNIEDVYRPIR